ncbi:hypothetical protein [Arthrobacter sp. ISL-30]|uniref:hypothetical protein n=1 Tax=Arthrobacter sp. ISL-30 TaxID=2819109 RepID=UPI001BE867B3|nr:hypothetical protein [Arthrobacter sp. ISL-30]MBT2513179.1 hypothetical protein [Arthrobacter sp. ISL-30]
MEELHQSPSWGAAVAAWRRAAVISRPGAERTIAAALETSTGAKDIAAVMHARLINFASRMPSGEFAVVPDPIHTDRPDLADLIDQVSKRIKRRTDSIIRAALVLDPEWKQNLLDALPPNIGADALNSAIGTVAIYRERWGVGDSSLPLGPVPADYEREQQSQTVGVQRLIDAASRAVANQDSDIWLGMPSNREPSLINVGWQL